MRIDQLDASVVGKRVRVTGVAPSAAEPLGYVDDVARLTGQAGEAVNLVGAGAWAQLWVRWDDPGKGGSLSLCARDEVEVLP